MRSDSLTGISEQIFKMKLLTPDLPAVVRSKRMASLDRHILRPRFQPQMQ